MPAAETVTITVQVILVLATFLIGGLTMLGYLGRYWWVLDLFSHFRVQYFLILLSAAILALVINHRLLAVSAGVFALINAIAILPLYKSTKRKIVDQQNQLRIILANVLQQNTSYARVLELIREQAPDFVVLIETNDAWIEAMKVIEGDYPYRIFANRDDNYGLSLFSRIPAKDADICTFGDAGVPSIVARFDIDGESLTIVCTHPPPPKGLLNSQNRNQQLGDIADFVAVQESHVCLCGDLNISPWSPYFKDLLASSGLVNSGIGFGVQPTWPVRMPLLSVPIDHCLGSPRIQILRREVGPAIGSDHYPLILDFAIGVL